MTRVSDSFIFGNAAVRVILDSQGGPWFVARDVAEALDYPQSTIAQLANLLRNIPDEWKGIKPINTLGGEQDLYCLSEPGLYWFLGRSDKEKALPFQKWVFGEVLPSIRKTGAYSLGLNMKEVKQIMRLPEAYKKEVFKRMLTEAGKENHAETMQLIMNISLVFAAAETGAPLGQDTLPL